MEHVKIHVEVPLFLSFFAFALTGAIGTNLNIYRTCYVILGYNETECALLGTGNHDNYTDELEKLVEPTATTIGMVQSVTTAIVSASICIFTGPWSDKFGRKPLLLATLTGYTLAMFGMTILILFPMVSPWWFLICSVPVMVTGGLSTYLTAVLSYLTDVTSEESRGFRMGIFEGTLFTGLLIGNIVSSYLFYATSYAAVYAIAGSCCLLGFIYTACFIKESLTPIQLQGHFKEFFRIDNALDMAHTSLKRREHFKRAIILLLLFMLAVTVFVMNGDMSVMFYYFRGTFDWSLEKYTLYNSVSNVLWISGTLIGVGVLHKILKIPESVLILCGFISVLNGALLVGLAKSDYVIYAAGVVRCLGGIVSPLSRSLLSKMVPPEEIGKIFSAIMICESLIGMLGSPLYVEIYNRTLNTNSRIFNFVTAGFLSLEILVISVIIVLERRQPQYLLINEEITPASSSE